MGLFNGLKWGQHFINSPYQALDFRTYYFSSKAYWQNNNPYSDSDQIKQLKSYPNAKAVNIQTPAGFPHATAVYAPSFIWFFGLYDLMDYTMAKWVQFVLNIGALIWIISNIKKANRELNAWLIAISIMAFRGTWYALDTGQPMLQVLAICLWAYSLYQKQKHPLFIAFLLAFVSFKFTLMLPFICLLFIAKDKRYLFSYIGTVILLNFSALIIHPYPELLLENWVLNMSKLWAFPHQYLSINGLNTVSTNISVLLKYLYNTPLGLLKIITGSALLLNYLFIYLKNKNLGDAQILLFLGLSNLCFGQHLVYDALILVVFKLMAIKKDETLSVPEILLLLFLIFPIGSIADKLQAPYLHFGLNFLIFINWMFVFKLYFLSKNKAIKNPN